MIRSFSRPVLAFVVAACASVGVPSSIAPVGAYPPPNLAARHPLTKPERTDFRETSSYADVMAFVDSLRIKSQFVSVTTLGKSSQGKDLPLLIVSRPRVRTPAEARTLNRPIVYIQGNIHGGEVEGKEALLALLRDLDSDRYANVLDSLVILAVPIYNADGNDAFGPQERTRGSQNGPPSVGQRANGQGYDLNRDYIKAEAPETRAALALFKEWDPEVFVDLHTTNGSYHGYALTWSPPMNPAARFTVSYTRDTLLPQLQDELANRRHILTFPYGDFVGRDTANWVWQTFSHTPRYGTNYYGLRGRISVLSEAYSHDPFKKRIASTYAFVSGLLSLIAANREDVIEAAREADRHTTAYGTTPSTSPRIAIRSRFTSSPQVAEVLMEVLERTGDTVRTEPGLRAGYRRLPKPKSIRIPIADRFEPTLEQTLPFAWVFPATQANIVEPLQRHGVYVEQLTDRATFRVERFTVDSIAKGRPFQQHEETSLSGRWSAPDTMTVEAGSYVVRGGQQLGILALYLLEPQSDDGLATWNFLDSGLKVGTAYPVVRATERIPAQLRPVRAP